MEPLSINDDILLVSENLITKIQIQVIYAAQKFVYSNFGCLTCMAKFDNCKNMLPLDRLNRMELQGRSDVH